MIGGLLWLVPAYVLVGVVVVGFALATMPREVRPDFGECVSVLLVGMVFWPLLVWAFFHEGDGR